MSLLAALKGAGPSGFGYRSTAEEVTAGLDLSGKTYLLTGCNSGIGLETLRVLALRGAHVLAAARSEDKAAAALRAVAAAGTPLGCELADPPSVRACAAAVLERGAVLDGIICNAGIMALPQRAVRHGCELQLLTNHVGHFILVTRLLEALAATGRVVLVSSAAHKRAPRGGIELDNLDGARGYGAWTAYGQSKLANILFARALARRMAGSQRTANALHPGVIRTNLGRHMPAVARWALQLGEPLLLKSIAQGAATQCYVATHPALAGVSGAYFADCNPVQPSRHALDDALGERLWQATEALVARLP